MWTSRLHIVAFLATVLVASRCIEGQNAPTDAAHSGPGCEKGHHEDGDNDCHDEHEDNHEDNEDDGDWCWWVILLVVVGSLVLITVVIVIAILVRRKHRLAAAAAAAGAAAGDSHCNKVHPEPADPHQHKDDLPPDYSSRCGSAVSIRHSKVEPMPPPYTVDVPPYSQDAATGNVVEDKLKAMCV